MYRVQQVLFIISITCLWAQEDFYDISPQINRGNLASTYQENLQLNAKSHDTHTTTRNYIGATPSDTNRFLNLSSDRSIKNNNKRKSIEYEDPDRMLYPSDMAKLSRNCSYGLCDDVDEYPFDKIEKILSQSELKTFFSTETIRLDSRFGEDSENLCTSITHTRFPKTAKNLQNVEQVIINVDQYKQGIIFETCKNEGPCNFAENFPNNFTPKCVQKYTVRKLMVVGKESDNAVFDDFKIPSCCVCMVKK